MSLSSVLLSHCELASGDVLLWRGLCCCMEAQSGEDASEEEEEERRGRSKGEAGVTVESSFSIMVESYWYPKQVLCSLVGFLFGFSVSCAFVPPTDFSTNLPMTRTSLWSAQIIRV